MKALLNYPDDYRPAHALDKVTKENYTPEFTTEGFYHVKIEDLQTNRSGVRVSVPRIVTYPPKTWTNMEANLVQMGHIVEVLYDPTEYNRSRRKAKEQASQARNIDVQALLQAQADKHAAEMEELKKMIAAGNTAKAPAEPKEVKERKPRTPKEKTE